MRLDPVQHGVQALGREGRQIAANGRFGVDGSEGSAIPRPPSAEPQARTLEFHPARYGTSIVHAPGPATDSPLLRHGDDARRRARSTPTKMVAPLAGTRSRFTRPSRCQTPLRGVAWR